MSDQVKKEAIIQFCERKKYSSMIRKIDSNGVHANEPFYFYCSSCGTPSEVLTCKPVFPVYDNCSQCRELIKSGWMQEAIKHYEN